MADDPKATGTTAAPSGTTAAAADGSGKTAAGGSVPDEKDQKLAGLENQVKQLLSEKSHVEAKARELAEREAAISAPTNAAQLQRQEWEQAQQTYLDTVERARQGDPVAQIALANYHGMQNVARQTAVEVAIGAMPGDLQKSVRDVMQKRPYLAPQDAREIVEGQQLASERAKQKEREAELERKEKELKAEEENRSRGVVSTGRRPVTATELQGSAMKKTEYYAELERLEAEGNFAKRRELVNKRRTGEIQLKE